jgi:hypothetical protein
MAIADGVVSSEAGAQRALEPPRRQSLIALTVWLLGLPIALLAWHSADGIVAMVPSQYPPLYPWLIGLPDDTVLAVRRPHTGLTG